MIGPAANERHFTRTLSAHGWRADPDCSGRTGPEPGGIIQATGISCNKAMAKAYGLSRDNFAHILGSFPVFARKHPEFFDFLAGRLDFESW